MASQGGAEGRTASARNVLRRARLAESSDSVAIASRPDSPTACERSAGYDVEEIEVPFAPPGVGMLWACRVAGPPRDDSIASRNSSA